jgi:hypothetical protein
MAKSQLNNMSKKEILQSLMYEQNQSNATLSRLITAAARAANVDPVKLAEMFTQDIENQEYVEKFNVSVKEIHTKRAATEKVDENIIAGKNPDGTEAGTADAAPEETAETAEA